MHRLGNKTLRRRAKGRKAVAILKSVATAISTAHCIKRPSSNPMGYIPQWDTEDDRKAMILVSSLARKVELDEAWATSMNQMIWAEPSSPYTVIPKGTGRGDQFCILTSGNKEEFKDIAEECKKRNVQLMFTPLRAGGRIFCIPRSDLHRLPYDIPTEEYYLGDDESGHSIYPMCHGGVEALLDYESSDNNISNVEYKWEAA